MSAALALDPAVLPGRPVRPRLHLVPTGDEVDATARQLRLSRRGRLVRTAGALAVATALGWGVAGAVAAAGVAEHTVTVVAGQTLSHIAAAELPELPVREGVAQLQLANGLSSADVHAGQVLRVPAHG